MVYLAPLISTLFFVVFIGLAIRKGLRSRPDLGSKEGSLVDLWQHNRRRLYLIVSLYIFVLYGGGLAGAAIANRGLETSFIAFVFAAIIGQMAALATVSVSIAMVRGFWSFRGLRRH